EACGRGIPQTLGKRGPNTCDWPWDMSRFRRTLLGRRSPDAYDFRVSVVSALLLVGVAALLALLIGAGLGAALTPRILERRQRRVAEQSGLTVSQMLDHIVSGSPVGIVVVDTYRDVVYTNDRARELGLVRDRLLDDRAWLAAERTLSTGEDGEVDLSPRKRANPGRSGLS